MKKTITKQTKIKTGNIIQYCISVIIAIIFGLGLISTKYQELFPIFLSFAIIQLIISAVRLRILNIVFDAGIIIIGIIAWIPIVGWPFRLLGLITILIEMSAFKNIMIEKKIKINYSNFKRKKHNKKNVKSKINHNSSNFKDANFKEK